ncbi:protein HGH1 homolog [Neocloeon triangulifer]|uniref:protein HGH1 homolog n=1 Tax=Neocloeon triangulifer TaxID=2078957 RepID=UPI00286F7958|nr:protein HGH1 homolog [Neocloeon triangulifer]
MAEALAELEQFLGSDVRPDLKDQALQHILGISASDEGRRLFLEAPGLVGALLEVIGHWNTPSLARDAALALINLSASPLLSKFLHEKGGVEALLKFSLDPESPVADPALMTLCNITRDSKAVESAWPTLESQLCEILKALSHVEYNKKGQTLHYLAPLISNLTQLAAARSLLLKGTGLMTLAAFTRFEASVVRRGGVVSALRNLCFEDAAVDFANDLLPPLLLPIAASDTAYTDEETEKLHIDLQFLPPEHQRELDPDLRRLILEALSQLAATKEGREALRENGTYLVLRELHKWEEDREALLACQNLAELLIRTEDEIGVDDLKKLDVPQHLVTSFEAMDKDFLGLKE